MMTRDGVDRDYFVDFMSDVCGGFIAVDRNGAVFRRGLTRPHCQKSNMPNLNGEFV
jgi:hypothetical protein